MPFRCSYSGRVHLSKDNILVNGLRDQDKQHIPSGTCSDCGEGLDCALGSDFRNFEDFASGLSEPDPLQENPFPVVEAGYFAKIWGADPSLQVWQT